MPLLDLELPGHPLARRLPPEVRAFIRDADARTERLFAARRAASLGGFVPSDAARIWPVLEHVATLDLAPGRTFCEWGSGLGVVTGLAALLELDACGIEIQRELVEAAEELAADHDLPVAFACGTFVPPEHQAQVDGALEDAFLQPGGLCAYDELDLLPADLDIVYAYPWPGEESSIAALFDACAASGALLLTWHGTDDVRLRRKL